MQTCIGYSGDSYLLHADYNILPAELRSWHTDSCQLHAEFKSSYVIINKSLLCYFSFHFAFIKWDTNTNPPMRIDTSMLHWSTLSHKDRKLFAKSKNLCRSLEVSGKSLNNTLIFPLSFSFWQVIWMSYMLLKSQTRRRLLLLICSNQLELISLFSCLPLASLSKLTNCI